MRAPDPNRLAQEELFASIDLDADLAASIPLVTEDITTRIANPPPPPPTALERLRGTIDLVLDKIEPFFTGDFIRATMDLIAEQTASAKSQPAVQTEEDLITVETNEAVEIVVDAQDLLDRHEEEVESGELPIVETGSIVCPVAPESFGTPLAQLAEIGRAPVNEYRAAAAPRPIDPADPAEVYRRATAELSERRFADARRALETLAREHPANTEYWAAAAYARFALEQDEKARAYEATRLAERSLTYPYCGATQAYAGRMFLELRRPQSAVRHLRAAVELEPDRADLLAELRQANEMLLQARELSIAGDFDADQLKRRASASERWSALELRRRDARVLPGALGAFFSLAVVLFAASVIFELGAHEQWIDPADIFAWVRALLLTVAAIAGMQMLLRHRPLRPADFQIDRYSFGAALVAGALLGANFPAHVVKLPIATIMVIVLVRVVAEELFFRGFIDRGLNRGLVGNMTPVVISAFLYLFYNLTFYSDWSQAMTLQGMIGLAIHGFGAGLIYSALGSKTESMTPPFIAHLTAAVIAGVTSAL